MKIINNHLKCISIVFVALLGVPITSLAAFSQFVFNIHVNNQSDKEVTIKKLRCGKISGARNDIEIGQIAPEVNFKKTLVVNTQKVLREPGVVSCIAQGVSGVGGNLGNAIIRKAPYNPHKLIKDGKAYSNYSHLSSNKFVYNVELTVGKQGKAFLLEVKPLSSSCMTPSICAGTPPK